MSSSTVEPPDLFDLKLLPAWVKEPAEPRSYEHYTGEEREQPRDRPRRQLAGQGHPERGEVDPAAMLSLGLIHGGRPVKVLARGDIGRALTVKAHAFSEAAKAKIEAAGGRTEIVI